VACKDLDELIKVDRIVALVEELNQASYLKGLEQINDLQRESDLAESAKQTQVVIST